MLQDIKIEPLKKENLQGAAHIFEIAIPDAFEKEGLSHLTEDIKSEIKAKKQMLQYALEEAEPFFLIAKRGETVVGTISFGPCGEDFKKCTDTGFHSIGELGSLYVLPEFQGKGIGSALIKTMVAHIAEQGIKQFCLDSGYKRAQKKWVKKFGPPFREIKDYWGSGSLHMVWIVDV